MFQSFIDKIKQSVSSSFSSSSSSTSTSNNNKQSNNNESIIVLSHRLQYIILEYVWELKYKDHSHYSKSEKVTMGFVCWRWFHHCKKLYTRLFKVTFNLFSNSVTEYHQHLSSKYCMIGHINNLQFHFHQMEYVIPSSTLNNNISIQSGKKSLFEIFDRNIRDIRDDSSKRDIIFHPHLISFLFSFIGPSLSPMHSLSDDPLDQKRYIDAIMPVLEQYVSSGNSYFNSLSIHLNLSQLNTELVLDQFTNHHDIIQWLQITNTSYKYPLQLPNLKELYIQTQSLLNIDYGQIPSTIESLTISIVGSPMFNNNNSLYNSTNNNNNNSISIDRFKQLKRLKLNGIPMNSTSPLLDFILNSTTIKSIGGTMINVVDPKIRTAIGTNVNIKEWELTITGDLEKPIFHNQTQSLTLVFPAPSLQRLVTDTIENSIIPIEPSLKKLELIVMADGIHNIGFLTGPLQQLLRTKQINNNPLDLLKLSINCSSFNGQFGRLNNEFPFQEVKLFLHPDVINSWSILSLHIPYHQYGSPSRETWLKELQNTHTVYYQQVQGVLVFKKIYN